MIMVRHIIAVPVHGPVEVFFKPVRMTMICNHLQMILNGLKHRRSMGQRRDDRPDDQCEARQQGKQSSKHVVCVFHKFTARGGCNRFCRKSTIRSAAVQVAALRRPIPATTVTKSGLSIKLQHPVLWARSRHSPRLA